MNEFRFPVGLRSVVSGVGATRERLGAELAAQSAHAPIIVCGARVGATDLIGWVHEALGRECPVFRGSKPHTPAETIDGGARFARENRADALIALGGSSAIDCAKGIAVLVAAGKATVGELEPARFGMLAASASGAAPAAAMAVVCVPTTLSMAEFQPFFGARDGHTKRKDPYLERGHVSRTVILDGEMAATTPASLWAETGVKCLDDALSRYCNSPAEPAADAVLEHAIAQLIAFLPESCSAGGAQRRHDVFFAAWLTGFNIPRAQPAPPRRPWFSTTVRHALGGALELGHGAGSCISLVPGLKFHRAECAARQDQLARRLGGTDLIEIVGELLTNLGVPRRLAELTSTADLDGVIANMVHEAPSLAPPDQLRALVAAL